MVARASFRSRPRTLTRSRPTLADLRAAAARPALRDQDLRLHLQEPGGRGGRSAGQLLEAAGCKGLQVGDARFSPKHANFIENLGNATTADVVALIAEGRRRVRDRSGIVLEPEVQLLGDVEFPWERRMTAPALARRALATFDDLPISPRFAAASSRS